MSAPFTRAVVCACLTVFGALCLLVAGLLIVLVVATLARGDGPPLGATLVSALLFALFGAGSQAVARRLGSPQIL